MIPQSIFRGERVKQLTRFDRKAELYRSEPFFRRAWQAMLDSEGAVNVNNTWRLGSVLFKADSILTGTAPRGMRLLEEAGFRAIGARVLRFDPRAVQLLWKYSLGRYTDERVQLVTKLLSCAPSYYVVYEAGLRADIPATVLLTALKGEAVPDRRASECLRSCMGGPRSAVFSLIHTADEPADFIRELGLLFTGRHLPRFLGTMRRPRSYQTLLRACVRLVQSTQRFTFEPADTLRRIRSLIEKVNLLPASGVAALRLFDVDDFTDSFRLRSLATNLKRHQLCSSDLDKLVIESLLIPLKRDWPAQPFPSCEVRHWSRNVKMGFW